uniref:Translation initiation factor IF- 2 domain-containing protein n=1 Tax=candidate division CPR3 bacterium TaxID=2268181 RepID=A0A7V3JA69_UNCC3
MVLLVAEMKGFKANPNKPAIGVVVESRLDPKVGPVAFLLIQDGTLKKGDFVVVGETWGRIRLIEDEHGHNLKTAGPSKPVKVTGLKAVPSFGQVLQVVPDEKTAQQVLAALKKAITQKEEQKTFKKIGLPIILKADVLGSLKALTDNIKKIETDEVAINIVKEGVGNITEDDVMMAKTTGAEILGFKVKPFASACEIAQKEKVKISIYDVIYNLMNDLKERIASTLKKEEKTVVGKGRILKIFLATSSEKIVGFKVLEGQVQKGNYVTIQRNGKEIGKGKVLSLQIEKEPVNEIKAGSLGGLKLSVEVDLEQGDILEFYKE